MANGRNKGRRGDTGRDAGGFIALTWSVLDCAAYSHLSMHARALLLELGRQFSGDNNGRLLLSRAYMERRGWKSADMLTKAKRELLAGGFIHETVKGQRPNRASWYAVTWQRLDRIPGYDPGALESFERGAYRFNAGKNAALCPSHGTESRSIAPPHGTGAPSVVPPHGAIRPEKAGASVPPHGHLLEMPSAVGPSATTQLLSGKPERVSLTNKPAALAAA